jgi:DNA-binding protein
MNQQSNPKGTTQNQVTTEPNPKIDTPKNITKETTPIPQESPSTSKDSPPSPRKTKLDNTILVGSKPLINYVKSVVLQFRKNNSPEVIIRSRGKFISKAVDIAEVARRRYLEEEGVKVKDIQIASEEFEKEGRKINVSTIDITLQR